MNENTIIARNPDHVASRLEDEVVMMNLDTGKYFNLNETGSRIWDLLQDDSKSLGELADMLVAEYDIDRRACLNDLIKFMETVTDKGILVIT